MKKNIRVRRIHWEKRPIKHTPSFQFEFVSIVGSKSVALFFGFYGAQVRLHMNFQVHNQKSSRIGDQLVANFEPWYLSLFISKRCIVFKTINRFGLSKCYQPRPWAVVITLITSSLIIPDVTKTSSNDCLIFYTFLF